MPEPPSSSSSIGSRSASATTANRTASASWIVAATRRYSRPDTPRASRSAIVRDSSCSTGRYSTDTVMNTADHSSVMRPYSASVSEWLASAKYPKVTRPVTPMPTERIAAPRP